MLFIDCIKNINWHKVCLLILFCAAVVLNVSLTAVAAEKEIICSKCGQTIYGTYYQFGKKILCPKDLPRCVICGRTCTKYYTRDDGKIVCPKDAVASALVCSNCHKPILSGKYMRLRDNLYSCSECEKSGLPRCFICSLPISSGGLVFSDGRRLCAFHSTTAVNDQASAQVYFRKAKSLINQYISPSININDVVVTIHIVDQKVLAEKMRSDYDNEPSLKMTCGKTLEYDVGGGKKVYRIYILQGLPSEDFLTTMIHECGHVWQMSHKVRRLGLRHQEGFCEWLSYKINKQLRRQNQILLLENKKDSIYHAGLQNYLKLESQKGKEGVLRSALGY